MGKILVTCATGNVGRQLVGQLMERNQPVLAATRQPEKARDILGPEVELVRFDFALPETYKAAFNEVDRLFLLTPTEAPDLVGMMTELITYAKGVGLQHIVNMSYMGVERSEHDPFGMIEMLVDESGIPRTFIQPNWFMQNFVTWDLEEILEREAVIAPAEEAKTSFVDTRDIAAVATAALTEKGHMGKTYVVTGPEALTHGQIAESISRHSGRNIKYESVSENEYRESLREFVPPHMVEMLIEIYRSLRAETNAPVTDDVMRVLGRLPVSFEQFSIEHAEIWKGGAQ